VGWAASAALSRATRQRRSVAVALVRTGNELVDRRLTADKPVCTVTPV